MTVKIRNQAATSSFCPKDVTTVAPSLATTKNPFFNVVIL